MIFEIEELETFSAFLEAICKSDRKFVPLKISLGFCGKPPLLLTKKTLPFCAAHPALSRSALKIQGMSLRV